jgi:SAM-dependent methyltransferase
LVSQRIDFSRNAGVYDRRHGVAIPDEGLERLWEGAHLAPNTCVLDIGAGTGRIAIPLARRGCRVVAVEPAAGMLAQLRSKGSDTSVLAVVAEGARLPFPNGYFDAVVIARLMYLTPDWRAILDETHRVLATGGGLLHEWGNGETGEEWVRIREEARRLFEDAGLQTPFHPGVRSDAEVRHHVAGLRFVEEGGLNLGPGAAISLREFLRRLVEGELSYTWGVPESVLAASLPNLQHWSEQTFDLDRQVPMPHEIRWMIYRKDAA